MKIIIRKDSQAEWEIVESAGYAAEQELQKLLAESPSLIDIGEIRESAPPLVVAVREFNLPGSGHTDILAFSPDGDIVVVECKLASSQEIKRKVIAQVLEYGAYLWNMSYEEINEKVFSRKNKNLIELISEAINNPEWDEEVFRTAVEENLSKGSFILVIAVDEINDELNRTMRFLNTCGNPEFVFTVLEMRKFDWEKTEVLVPHLHGGITKTKGDGPIRKQWTESEFMARIETELDTELNELIYQLYKWTKEKADRVWFGTGIEKGSYTFHYLIDERTVSIFSVYTDGYMKINYGWLVKEIGMDLVSEFHQSLTHIEPFSQIPAEFNRWPAVKVEEAFLNHPDYLNQFKKAVENLGERLKN